MSSMVLWVYKYVKIIMILVLELYKWQVNIIVVAQIMDIMTI